MLTELGSFAKYCHQSIDSTVLVHLDGVAMTLLNYELIGEEADSLWYANTWDIDQQSFG